MDCLNLYNNGAIVGDKSSFCSSATSGNRLSTGRQNIVATHLKRFIANTINYLEKMVLAVKRLRCVAIPLYLPVLRRLPDMAGLLLSPTTIHVLPSTAIGNDTLCSRFHTSFKRPPIPEYITVHMQITLTNSMQGETTPTYLPLPSRYHPSSKPFPKSRKRVRPRVQQRPTQPQI